VWVNRVVRGIRRAIRVIRVVWVIWGFRVFRAIRVISVIRIIRVIRVGTSAQMLRHCLMSPDCAKWERERESVCVRVWGMCVCVCARVEGNSKGRAAGKYMCVRGCAG
jgi:hypothetical protein